MALNIERNIQVRPSDKLLGMYGDTQDLITLVIKGSLDTLFIHGGSGLGKTYMIRYMLRDVPGVALLGGHLTPYMLYYKLHENRHEKIIVFDDTEDMLGNKIMLALLKQALDTNKPKKVMWHSSRMIGNLPKSFGFDSRCVFLFNTYPKDEGFKALLTRADVREINFSHAELLVLMKEVASQDGKVGSIPLPSEKRLQIVEFIQKFSDPSTANFSLRTQEKIERYYANFPNHWDKMALNLLNQKDEMIAILLEVLSMDEEWTMEERARMWIQKTNKSRRTFFRLKKVLEENEV